MTFEEWWKACSHMLNKEPPEGATPKEFARLCWMEAFNVGYKEACEEYAPGPVFHKPSQGISQ